MRILPENFWRRFLVPFSVPTFVPVDAQADFVLMCDYTGKEVVE
jgi:hypothetical protein